ncbi:putative quorum-quenching lactonase YtnP [termite gut metagenome]|uniref:Putative quorum-quenching lactonase YtnP n=1 Tax=termite gut metagenome TaxID=433724 RepID=A0A5J4QER2_9ZZZZ
MRNYILLFIFFLCISPFGRLGAQEPLTFNVGDFQVSVLPEGGQNAKVDILKGATPEALRKYLPDGTFSLQIQVFLVRTPGCTLLVDAGYGTNLPKNLKSLGVSEEDIHVILLTHMHGDHIGGLLRDGKKVFPNADLYLSKAEFDYWTGEKERGADARKVLDAYKDKLHIFVPAELGKTTTDLFPGIQPIAAYGHTPGHTTFLIESNKTRLLLWGDVAHAVPIQMPCPEVALSFDSNPIQAIQTRKSILEYVSKNKIRVVGAHIPFPAIGDIAPGKEEGYEFIPTCACEGY